PVLVDGIEVPHRGLHYLQPGRTGVDVSGPVRSVLLLGGEPFTSPLVMWWNFVGRDHDDIAEARHDWMAQPVGGRFGRVEGHGEQFVPAPEMATTRLRPRVPLRR